MSELKDADVLARDLAVYAYEENGGEIEFGYLVNLIKQDIIYLRHMHASYWADKRIRRKFKTDLIFTYKKRLKLERLHNLNKKRIYKLLKNSTIFLLA